MRMRSLVAFVAGIAAGAAAEYLLDPADGRRRRHTIRDRASAMLRRGARETRKKAHYAADTARGVAAEAMPPGRDSSELNDAGLAAKVKSELFRPADSPKDSVEVNVEDHVVVLRGTLASPEQIDELVKRARQIDGVSEVESHLHT